MARTFSWLPRQHKIRQEVENSVRSHYGRKDLQRLFGVQERAAGKLLEMLPADSPIGTAHLVKREELLRFLEAVRDTDDVGALAVRQREQKGLVGRQKLRGLTQRDWEELKVISLPDTVTLERGRLEVRFATVEQLSEGLWMLARMLADDLDEVVRLYEPARSVHESEQKRLEREDFQNLFARLREMEEAHERSTARRMRRTQ